MLKNQILILLFLYCFFPCSEIKVLNDINARLNERYEIKSKYNVLKNELKHLEEAESTRKAKYNKDKKKELIEMEHIGQDLCQEHGKVIHQIEHINWHLSHAHPHEIQTPIETPHIPPKICHADGILSGHGHGHIHGKLHCTSKPSANMVNIFNLFFFCLFIINLLQTFCAFFHIFLLSKGLSTNQRRTNDQNHIRITTQNLSSETKFGTRNWGMNLCEQLNNGFHCYSNWNIKKIRNVLET